MSPVVPYHFPQELQHIIFKIAARIDISTAQSLVLVAKHVYTWIRPILYETIVVRSSASLLLATLTSPSKPPTAIKNLAIASDSISIRQAKSLLAVCSHHTSSFAILATHRNPSIFLPFLKSPHITSLVLASHHPNAELTIPPGVLGTLTHLVIIGGPYTWFHLRQAAHHVRDTGDREEDGPGRRRSHSIYALASDPNHTPHPSNAAALDLFQSLTHFAVCAQNWGSYHSLLRVARRLRCFAIVVPPSSDLNANVNAKLVATVRQRIEEMGDPRVVLVQYELDVEWWEREVRSGGRDGLWERVERMGGDKSKKMSTF